MARLDEPVAARLQALVLHERGLVRLAEAVLLEFPPNTELCYDYGYRIDSVVGADGKVVEKKCFCGTPSCRGRMY